MEWIVTRVDGKIASVDLTYKGAAKVMAAVAKMPACAVKTVATDKVDTEALYRLSDILLWEDLLLFGSPFQKQVWKALFDLTHSGNAPKLLSYTDFAESIDKGPGVRAVAHAIGLNPVPVIIPCHLIIPKESIERIHTIQEENALFGRKALYIIDTHVDYGEYALGADLKRELILRHLD